MIKHMTAGATLGFCLFYLLSCGQPIVKPFNDVSWADDIERDKREIMGPISWTKPKEETTNENDTTAYSMGERKQTIIRYGNGARLPYGRFEPICCYDRQ